MVQSDMPQSRNGKPKQVITTILKDLDRLRAGSTIKVPLTELAESKEKVRSPLSRATREASRKVATASDTSYLLRVERKRVARASRWRSTNTRFICRVVQRSIPLNPFTGAKL